MIEETKRVWDVVLALLTMIGALVAFVLSLVQWRKGQTWQRAAKGRELVDALLNSDDSDEEYYAWDAMKMLDYQQAKKPLLTKPVRVGNAKAPDVKEQFPVGTADIQRALTSSKNNETDSKLLYVRECFDDLYFRLGQLQDAIENDLVEFRHVSTPMDYYTKLLAEAAGLHHTYMKKNGYSRALRFLENYPVWREVCANESLPPSSEIEKAE